jgi:hypothetical protein
MIDQTSTSPDVSTTTTTTTSVGLRYGLITGFVSVIFSLVLFVTEMNTNKVLSNLSILILIAGIIFAYRYFKSANNGFMSYGQGLGIGAVLSAVTGLLGGIFTFIYVKFIDSSFMQRMQETQIEELEARGMSDEQIEQGMAMAEKFSGPGMMLVMGILVTLLIGFILSLVIAAIMKRSQPEFE